jgi:IclR family pca regulon transcriptional regulator
MTLEPITPRTVTTVAAVMAHVDACRAQGFAVCDGELELEVRSMAVPLVNREGKTVAALSIAVRAERMDVAELARAFLPALRRAQGRLRDRLFED